MNDWRSILGWRQHKMITLALRNGVKPERIAAALNVPVRVVVASMRLLDGIHDEAIDLLKDKNISAKAVRLLRRVTGIRQIVIAELWLARIISLPAIPKHWFWEPQKTND